MAKHEASLQSLHCHILPLCLRDLRDLRTQPLAPLCAQLCKASARQRTWCAMEYSSTVSLLPTALIAAATKSVPPATASQELLVTKLTSTTNGKCKSGNPKLCLWRTFKWKRLSQLGSTLGIDLATTGLFSVVDASGTPTLAQRLPGETVGNPR